MRQFFVAAGMLGVVLGWNAPNHYPPWPTFHLELASALGLCCLGLAFLLFKPRPSAVGRGATAKLLRPTTATWIWLLAGAVPTVQFLAGMLHFRGDALLGFLYGSGAAMAIYVGQVWCAQEDKTKVFKQLWVALLLGGIISNGLALYQWAGLPTPGWWAMELIDDRPYGAFGQPNHFGLLMVLSIVAAVALYELATLPSLWVLSLAVTFLSSGVLISQSRAALLALAALPLVWLWMRQAGRTRLRTHQVVLAIASFVLLALAFQHGYVLLEARTPAPRELTEVGARKQIWLHFWAAIVERPWLGYGFNQTIAALAEVADRVEPSRNTIYAHNFVLDLMTWFGAPLALAMTAALFGWVLGWLRRSADPAMDGQRACVFAVWLALIIQSLLEFPYAHAYFLLPACLLAGCASARTGNTALTWRPDPKMRAFGLVGVVLLCVTAYEYFAAEDDFRFNRFARANFINRPAHQYLERALVLDQLAALNRSARLQPKPDMSAQDIEELHILSRRFHILSVRFDYAKALALNGRMADANHELVVIRAAHAPSVFQSIQRGWDQWLSEHREEIKTGSR